MNFFFKKEKNPNFFFQPAVYVFCLDVSHAAVATGYLKVFCDTLLDELEKLPGDSRTQIGFITYDRVVHFYSMSDGATQPTQLVSEIAQLGPIWAVETGPKLGSGYWIPFWQYV